MANPTADERVDRAEIAIQRALNCGWITVTPVGMESLRATIRTALDAEVRAGGPYPDKSGVDSQPTAKSSNQMDQLNRLLDEFESAVYHRGQTQWQEDTRRAIVALFASLTPETKAESVARPATANKADAGIARNSAPSASGMPPNKLATQILMRVIETVGQLDTISDMDDACVRVVQRMIAEVLGLPLDKYPLLKEPLPRKPLYYADYSPEKTAVARCPCGDRDCKEPPAQESES